MRPVRLAIAAAVIASTTTAAAQLPGDARRFEAKRGCELRYRVHPAAVESKLPVALIAHGFLRNGEFMEGWAQAFAAVGVTAVTVDLCSSSALDGRHADNGADLVALRHALGIDEAIYVGVSAGGLAALVAAANDTQATRGLLLLDPVNAGGQARAAAGRIRVPVLALVARPQMCNAWRNIDRALETMPHATIVPIEDASHCDFEWPTDRFCRVACIATNSHDERERAASRVRSLGIEFVRSVAGADAERGPREIDDTAETAQPDGPFDSVN
jgi:pimeloyl-ACP methyl ester carboxylesterase